MEHTSGLPSTIRPTAGYQNWRHLVFLHWRVDPKELQHYLPQGLTVETCDGDAWLALVPFRMERVRPWWSPPVPGISWFLETNLRTYVRHKSGLRAVWFFSLDANSRLAVRIARKFWQLNYVHCRMQLDVQDDSTLEFTGRRTANSTGQYTIRCQPAEESPVTAQEGTLEYFLLERYALLSQTGDGQFWTGEVVHEPYRYTKLANCQCEQNYTSRLLQQAGPARPPDHAVYSSGVDVRVTSLQPVT